MLQIKNNCHTNYSNGSWKNTLFNLKKKKIKLYNCKITHFLEDKVKLKKKSRRGTCYASRC